MPEATAKITHPHPRLLRASHHLADRHQNEREIEFGQPPYRDGGDELEEFRKAHQSELQLLQNLREWEGQKSESILLDQNERIQELENSVRQFEAGNRTIEDGNQITR
jgi:hypothetical protein